MRLKSGSAVDSFWPGNEIRARVPVLQQRERSRGTTVTTSASDARNCARARGRQFVLQRLASLEEIYDGDPRTRAHQRT